MKYFGLREPFTHIDLYRYDSFTEICATGRNAAARITCPESRVPELIMLFATRVPVATKDDWLLVDHMEYDGEQLIREDGDLILYGELCNDD